MSSSSRKYGGPSLPRTLLDQIGGSGNTKRQRRPGHHGPLHRKDQRKLEREQKRQQRVTQIHPIHRRTGPSESASSNDETEIPVNPSPTRRVGPRNGSASGNVTQSESKLKHVKENGHSVSKQEQREKSVAIKPLSSRAKERLAHDDANIAALEKKLGIKGNTPSKAMKEDGLDDLLGDILNEADSSSKRKRTEDKIWLDSKRRKVDEIASGSEDEEEDGNEDDFDEDLMETVNDTANTSFAEHNLHLADYSGEELATSEGSLESEDEDAHEPNTDDMEASLSPEDADLDDFVDFDEEEKAPESSHKKRARENPYVAPGASDGQITGKYIPPSLRAASTDDAELTTRLRRQTQGLLNRLSEANIISLLGEVEKLYQDYPRQYVTTTLIDLLLNLICDRATLMDNFLVLHAGIAAAIYKVIGPDFGAQMVERLVDNFDHCYSRAEGADSGGKEYTNLISLLAQLYNLQVIGCELIFDYLRIFLNTLTEIHTELILRIVRSSGYQLRQDDPSSLKDIVMLLHKTVAEQDQQNLSVRTKFMIETINDLKNNKIKAGVTASILTSEHLSRMRKVLGSLNTRSIRAAEPLRISLSDIRNTDKRGKWWLVGASWRGKENIHGQSSDNKHEVVAKRGIQDDSMDDEELNDEENTTNLFTLAKNARMNTDIRRAIFMAIMSASDHKDAHMRLLKLTLTRSQELEIPRVVLHCVGAEQAYNPYYTVIARKLCEEHRLRMAFQFALWDMFKRMGEKGEDDEDDVDDVEVEAIEMASMVNHAKFYAALLVTGGLNMGVLKNLDLVYLQPKTKDFLEVLFISILLQCSQAKSKDKKIKVEKRHTSALSPLSCLDIFTPALGIPGLSAGLLYFLRKIVAKTDLAQAGNEMHIVKKRCRDAVLILTSGSRSLA